LFEANMPKISLKTSNLRSGSTHQVLDAFSDWVSSY
jgi:hypothetical protein